MRWDRDVMPGYGAGAVYHIARTVFPPTGSGRGLHSHDFAELFWIERGRGWHLVADRRLALASGDLVFVRPGDAHQFRVADAGGFSLVNLALPVAVLEPIRRRHFAGSGGTGARTAALVWPWRPEGLPLTVRLTPAQIDRLNGWAGQLAGMRQSLLEIEACLLDLFNEVCVARRPGTDQTGATLPAWLQEAVAQLQRPERIAGGAGALADLAGRSAEHISRIVRARTGMTTTQFILGLKLERAARQLRMTDRAILEVALDCGLGNAAYFYRVFKRRYGLTPRHYRLRQQTVF
jgi:AraC family cel operon transcriptional repressor